MIHEKTENFYNQKINITTIREYRFHFFENLCKGKKVMHIGCADSMVFNIDSNLHIFLSKIDGVDDPLPEPTLQDNVDDTNIETELESKSEFEPEPELESEPEPEPEPNVNLEPKTILHGLDIDEQTLKQLAEACPGTYFTSYDQVTDTDYDLVLVPEVMEHVPNVQSFIQDVLSISSKEYLFTVPNMSVAQIFCDDTYSLEMIHPDHKCWFSPYTLYNVMNSYTKDFNMKMYYLENKSQIGIRLWKKTEEEMREEKLKEELKEEENHES